MLFILPPEGPSGSYPVYLSTSIVNSFEANDQRKANWVDSVIVNSDTFYYAYKYKIGASNTTTKSENLMLLRLAEQYLIRAEARVQQNDLNGAVSDLNDIRLRAGLSNRNDKR